MARLGTIYILCLLLAPAAEAGEVAPVAVRNQHPVLHVYGLPAFQTAAIEAQNRGTFRVSFDMANHAESGDDRVESLVLDGESYFLNLSWRRGVRDWLEVGVDIPLASHAGGSLDGVIKNWHDIWGLSNSKRKGPDDELQLRYAVAAVAQFETLDSVSGIGDIQLSAAVPLKRGGDGDENRMALRFGVKLPTGDADDLLGSGALDASVGLYADRSMTVLGHPTGISAFAGVIGLGSGDILPDRQRDVVPFGGVATTWHLSDRLAVTGQFQAQGSYIRSDLDELGGTSIQLAVGGAYRFRRSGWQLTLAVVEDLIQDATPDFGLYIGVSRTRD